MWHDFYDSGHYWGMHWFWWVFGVLLILFLFVSLWRYWRRNKGGETAMDILKDRFARGEIDEEEFEKRKNVLMRN